MIGASRKRLLTKHSQPAPVFKRGGRLLLCCAGAHADNCIDTRSPWGHAGKWPLRTAVFIQQAWRALVLPLPPAVRTQTQPHTRRPLPRGEGCVEQMQSIGGGGIRPALLHQQGRARKQAVGAWKETRGQRSSMVKIYKRARVRRLARLESESKRASSKDNEPRPSTARECTNCCLQSHNALP